MSGALVINEIYLSLQGESTFAGLPCIFIRLTACDLRCSYCDTAYAFTEGKKMVLKEILAGVQRFGETFRRNNHLINSGLQPGLNSRETRGNRFNGFPHPTNREAGSASNLAFSSPKSKIRCYGKQNCRWSN